jgi:regulator of sigma D
MRIKKHLKKNKEYLNLVDKDDTEIGLGRTDNVDSWLRARRLMLDAWDTEVLTKLFESLKSANISDKRKAEIFIKLMHRDYKLNEFFEVTEKRLAKLREKHKAKLKKYFPKMEFPSEWDSLTLYFGSLCKQNNIPIE